MNEFASKKVLLVGLGILGGGVETAKFLLKSGAKLTVTDLRDEHTLAPSLAALSGYDVLYVLGRHRESDFLENEIIVFNQAVSSKSKWVLFAKAHGKMITSDVGIFANVIQNKKRRPEILAVTGTRGKTTISTWLHHFLDGAVLGGNIPMHGLLAIADKHTDTFVVELSSFQLEYMMYGGGLSPKIAIISNMLGDHLDRYETFQEYLKVKSNMFLNQTRDDILILNEDDPHTHTFLQMRPRASIYYFSLKALPREKNGLFIAGDSVYFQEDGERLFVHRIPEYVGTHQTHNVLAAALGAYLYKRSFKNITKKLDALSVVPFRQEVVFDDGHVRIVNDSTATSPDATISAIERFSKNNDTLILITGGTDKKLNYKKLALKIKKYIPRDNLFLIEGSATKKLV